VVNAATIIDTLEGAGYRTTAPRRVVAGLIAESPGHFTAEELLVESRRRRLGVTRATMFRSLDVLAATGVRTVLVGHGDPITDGVASAVDRARQNGAA